MKLPFLPCFALADSAARVLSQFRPAGEDDGCRQVLRAEAVAGLRWLWQTGDAEQRTTVASRVAVWMQRDVARVHARVWQRERERQARISQTTREQISQISQTMS